MDEAPKGPRRRAWLLKAIGVVVAAYVVVILALMWWWDYEPPHFDVASVAQQRATAKNECELRS